MSVIQKRREALRRIIEDAQREERELLRLEAKEKKPAAKQQSTSNINIINYYYDYIFWAPFNQNKYAKKYKADRMSVNSPFLGNKLRPKYRIIAKYDANGNRSREPDMLKQGAYKYKWLNKFDEVFPKKSKAKSNKMYYGKIIRVPGVILRHKGRLVFTDLKSDDKIIKWLKTVMEFPKFHKQAEVGSEDYRIPLTYEVIPVKYDPKQKYTDQKAKLNPLLLHDQIDNNPSNDDCGIKILEQREFTERQLLKYFGIKHRTDGITPKQMYDFCVDYNIRIGICDGAYDVLYNYNPGTKKAGIWLLFQDEHFRIIKDKQMIKQIFNPTTDEPVFYESRRQKKICRECEVEFPDLASYRAHMATHDERPKFTVDQITTEHIQSESAVYHTTDDYIRVLQLFIQAGKVPRISKDLTSISYGKLTIRPTPLVETSAEDLSDLTDALEIPAFGDLSTIANYLFDKAFPIYKSTFNLETSKIFGGDVPIAIVTQLIQDYKKLWAEDCVKHYSDVLSKYDYPVYTSLDTVTDYKGNIQHPAYYYVDNNFTHRGIQFYPGWYSSYLVKYLLKFYELDIRRQLIPSYKLNAYELHDFVAMLYDTKHPSIKELIVKFIGSLRKIEHKIISKPVISSSAVDYNYFVKNGHQVCEILPGHYLFQKSRTIPHGTSAVPIYNSIIQNSYITILQALDFYESKGIPVIAIKTDCVYYDSEVPIDYKPITQQDIKDLNNNILGTFKPSEPVENFSIVNRVHRTAFGMTDLPELQPGEILLDDSLTNLPVQKTRYKTIFDLLSGETLLKSFFLNAMPGVGKSYAIEQIKKKLDELGKSYVCLSFQNNAAYNISGSTFHKFMQLSIDTLHIDRAFISKMSAYDYIIIDEVQQTPDYILSYLHTLKQKSNVKFLLFGDLDQFIAINRRDTIDRTEKTIDYENHPVFNSLYDFYRLNVYENLRIKNTSYVNALRSKDFAKCLTYCTAQSYDFVICYYNKTVNYYNNKMHLAFTGGRKTIIPGTPLICYEQAGDATKGTHYKLVKCYTKNEKKYARLVVDERFHKVPKLPDGSIEVIDVRFKLYKVWFSLGYAFTGHKSIGLTINANYMIANYDLKLKQSATPERDCERYRYVALSRCVDPSQIIVEDCESTADYELEDQDLDPDNKDQCSFQDLSDYY